MTVKAGKQSASVAAGQAMAADKAGIHALSDDDKARFTKAVKEFEADATDELFREDIGIRGVNTAWAEKMRGRIAGRDLWMSGQQLMDEGSGVVDRLVRTAAR